MAKNKTSNNDLFKNFNPPKINTAETTEEKKPSKKVEENPTVVEETIPEPVKLNIDGEMNLDQSAPDSSEMSFAMPTLGRPKVLTGTYHNYNARIREELFEYVQSLCGKNKPYQSVNDYINRLIARDMLSKNEK